MDSDNIVEVSFIDLLIINPGPRTDELGLTYKAQVKMIVLVTFWLLL